MAFDPDDPRLTALALGEIDDPAERAELERLLSAKPDARAFVDELRELGGMLRAQLREEPMPAPNPGLREAIEACAPAVGGSAPDVLALRSQPGAELPKSGRGLGWKVSTWLPLAASVAMAVGGFAAGRLSMSVAPTAELSAKAPGRVAMPPGIDQSLAARTENAPEPGEVFSYQPEAANAPAPSTPAQEDLASLATRLHFQESKEKPAAGQAEALGAARERLEDVSQADAERGLVDAKKPGDPGTLYKLEDRASGAEAASAPTVAPMPKALAPAAPNAVGKRESRADSFGVRAKSMSASGGLAGGGMPSAPEPRRPAAVPALDAMPAPRDGPIPPAAEYDALNLRGAVGTNRVSGPLVQGKDTMARYYSQVGEHYQKAGQVREAEVAQQLARQVGLGERSPAVANRELAVAESADRRLMASAAGGAAVTVFENADGRVLRRLEGHSGRVVELVFSPDGSRLATVGEDRKVRLWDVSTGRLLRMLTVSEGPTPHVEFGPDGVLLLSGLEEPPPLAEPAAPPE